MRILMAFWFLFSLGAHSDEIRDGSGLPVVFSVDEVLKKKQVDLVAKEGSVKGFLYYKKTDEVAYIFNDISDLIAFESEKALIAEVPKTLQNIFERRSLCHVVLRGVFSKDGFSDTKFILKDINNIALSEVFAYDLSEKEQMDNYTCTVRKMIQ